MALWRCGARTNQCVFPVSPSQLLLINPILAADPLHGDGWQELCSWCNTPLAQLLTLLFHPAVEDAVTHSGGSRHLTFQVTFHLAFTIYYLPSTISCAPVGAQASKLGVPFTIYGLRHRYRLRLFIIAQSYKKSTNYARKYFTISPENYQRLSKIVKDCQCLPKIVSDSLVLRTFAVAKVLPLDHTIKTSFIVSCLLKRTFASC